MYTTIQNVESALGTLTDSQQAYFTNVLSPAIDQMIDNAAETTFGGTTVVSVYTSGHDTTQLMIPTMHSVTTVIDHDGNTIDPTTYYLTPRTGDSYGIINSNGTWNDGVDNYQVSGVLGYAVVPPAVTAVATDLAILALQTATSSHLMREKVGDWEAFYKNTQMGLTDTHLAILSTYRRLSRSI